MSCWFRSCAPARVVERIEPAIGIRVGIDGGIGVVAECAGEQRLVGKEGAGGDIVAVDANDLRREAAGDRHSCGRRRQHGASSDTDTKNV
jgi:hypothetical protein